VTPPRKFALSFAFLVCVHGFVILAGFFAPYDFAAQHREQAFAPPTRIHFFDQSGHFHWRPFLYAPNNTVEAAPVEIDANGASASRKEYPVRFLVDGSAYKIAGLIPARRHLFGASGGAQIFLLGTDGYGRDQLSRFLYGGQISLLAGLLAAALSVCFGAAVGSVAGFYGGWIDHALMRVAELFLASPWLYLLFAVRATLPLHVAEWQVFILLVGVLGLLGWARPARLVRGVVLSAKERNFVAAARGFGASNAYLLKRHVLPQTYGVLLTQVALLIPQYVLAEVTLSFLGLGVGEPLPSWGSLLSNLQQFYVLSSYWWMFLPAMLLIPVFLAYYFVADALQEHVKPVSL
jgi:peptide/nickel transport system permease protein